MRTGIFSLINWKKGKRYIGGGIDVDRTVSDLKSELKRGSRKTELFRDYKEQKGKDFEFEVIEECGRKELRGRVDELIEEYKTIELGYNKRKSCQKSDLVIKYPVKWYIHRGNNSVNISQ